MSNILKPPDRFPLIASADEIREVIAQLDKAGTLVVGEAKALRKALHAAADLERLREQREVAE